MLSLYDWFMKPLESMGIKKARTILIKRASGDVLELGAGTGANLIHYDFNQVKSLVVTDRTRSKHLKLMEDKVSFVQADATALPFPNQQFDTVVHTLVFCSVDDVDAGLQEIKRVLKQDGRLIFIEHVLPHKKGMRRLFQWINPVWRKVSQGCSLTKDFGSSLARHGFAIERQGRFLNTVFFYGIATVQDAKTT